MADTTTPHAPHGWGANAAAVGLHTPARGVAFLAGYGHAMASYAAERAALQRAIRHLVAATADLGAVAGANPAVITTDIIDSTEAHP